MFADLARTPQFRFFSETLLASVLAPEYERGIIDYRESHSAMVMGMTRFRIVTDDMPVVGFGWGALSHDRTMLFHATLAGHSANYISRGTFGGTEQRQIYGRVEERWRNDCGTGGEDCSLCMVSSVAPAMWIRWMLVQEDPDPPSIIHLARGAPARWYNHTLPFGISNAPTRQGRISFNVSAQAAGGTAGQVSIQPNPGQQSAGQPWLASVRVGDSGSAPFNVNVHGAVILSADQQAGTVVFRCNGTAFSFIARPAE